MRKICEVDVESVSPISIGGANPDQFDTFRNTSLRGNSRWVLRALIGGVAFDAKLDEVNAAICAQERVFGSTSQSSLIIYRISNLEITGSDLNLRNNPQTLAKYVNPSQFRKIKVKIHIYSSRLTNREERTELSIEEELGIISTLLALTLLGLGKRTRRGFGNFYIQNIRLYGKSSNELNAIINTFKRISKEILSPEKSIDIQEIASELREIMRNSISIAKKFIDRCNINTRTNNVPRFPVFSQDYSSFYLIKIDTSSIDFKKFRNVRMLTPLDVTLALLQRTYFNKSFNKRASSQALLGGLAAKYQGVFRHPRNSARSLGSYILGLPRKANPTIIKDSNIKIVERFNSEINKNEKEIKETIRRFIEQLPTINQKKKDEIVNDIFDVIKNIIYLKDKREIKTTTGYIFIDSDRRPSPLILSTVKLSNNLGVFSIIVFSSKDWPGLGLWISQHKSKDGNSHKIDIYILSLLREKAELLMSILVDINNVSKPISLILPSKLKTKCESKNVTTISTFLRSHRDLLVNELKNVFKEYCYQKNCFEHTNVWPE